MQAMSSTPFSYLFIFSWIIEKGYLNKINKFSRVYCVGCKKAGYVF